MFATDLMVALDCCVSVALELLDHPNAGVGAVARRVELETSLVRREGLVVPPGREARKRTSAISIQSIT